MRFGLVTRIVIAACSDRLQRLHFDTERGEPGPAVGIVGQRKFVAKRDDGS